MAFELIELSKNKKGSMFLKVKEKAIEVSKEEKELTSKIESFLKI